MLKLLQKRKPKKGKNKTSSVMDLVRKNQMAYEKFITKKVPKLLRALGVSSDSGSSDENIFLLFVDACLASSSLSSDDVARTRSTRVSDLEVDAPSSSSFPAVGVSGTSTVSRFESFFRHGSSQEEPNGV
jgi:hypothetical protein